MCAGVALLVGMTAWSAISAKNSRRAPALMSVERVADVTPASDPQGGPEVTNDESVVAPALSAVAVSGPATSEAPAMNAEMQKLCSDPAVRWFNGRPAKPAQTIEMTVTAYSPDAQSCDDSADGFTATMHRVETNCGHLVAADPKLLPYGSMLSIEGYAEGQIVPVLDCGGAIKGRHIDLLFPTDHEAREWGVKKIRVTVWQYVDGKPAGDPRKMR
jgi:3D (Asp-Asp-Asp) domain-containing protein